MTNATLHTKLLGAIGIAAIMLQVNAVPFEALLFQLNQKHIASALCEHKSPHCNGQCFLMKQMTKAATNDKKAVSSGHQLDGHYLPVASKNLILSSSNVNLFSGTTPAISAGWNFVSPHPPRVV